MAQSGQTRQVVIEGRSVRLTNQDKVLWPEEGLTKGDLVTYYRAVARVILPHLHNRPLTLKIYPDGIDAGPIFLQAAPHGTPEWVQTWQHHLVSRGGRDAVNRRIVAED